MSMVLNNQPKLTSKNLNVHNISKTVALCIPYKILLQQELLTNHNCDVNLTNHPMV